MMFISLFIAFSAISALFTEAVKKATKTDLANNLIALLNAIVVGAGGTAIVYETQGVQFTPVNISYMAVLTLAVWIGSMVGFDKVKQTVEQLFTK
jgi:predicted MFS family arabinose efflux permease